MTATSGIYEIRCLTNGKRYIGQSLKVSRRLRGHLTQLEAGKHANPLLQHAWGKYGPAAFDFKQILICRPDDLTFYEQIIADAYRGSGLFNLGDVVDAPNRGRQWSIVVRTKMSAGHQRARADPVTGPKMAAATRKATKLPKYRENMAHVVKKRWSSPDFRAALTRSGYFKRLSDAVSKAASTPESRRRRSAAAHKQWEDEGRRDRQSATLRATLAAPSQRERIRRNNVEMWKDPAHRARISEAAAQRNTDPEFRRKFLAAVARSWNNADDRRAKASARMKEMRAIQKGAKQARADETKLMKPMSVIRHPYPEKP